MNSKLTLLFICSIFLIMSSCKNDDEIKCIPVNIESSMTVTKKNINCEEIDILWDVSFGVELEVSAISQCNESCSNNTIGYIYRLTKNNPQGSVTIQEETIFFAKCGNMRNFTNTLNTELGEPEEYFIGDTIIYEIYKYKICSTPNLDSQECDLCNFVSVESSPIRASYILNESDFCN